MKTLTFQPETHESITHFTQRIRHGDPNPFITLVISHHADITMIGGPSSDLCQVTIPKEDNPELPTGFWSFSATAFRQYWQGQAIKLQKKEPITLKVIDTRTPSHLTLEGITDLNSFRYAESQPACEHHLAFYNAINTKSTRTLKTDQAIAILNTAETYVPYQVFELSKEDRMVRIERDNDILPFPLPDTLDVDFNMTLTPEAMASMAYLAHSTHKPTLSMYLDDEQAIFSDGITTLSHSLAPLRAYREKQQQHYELEAKIVINIFEFKKELQDFKNIEEVSKANQALLYIASENVYLGALSSAGSVMRLQTANISVTHPQVYAVNLNAITKVKIKDITGAKAIKLTVLKNTHGERKLGFHNDKDKEHPYVSVPLELATSKLAELKQRIEAEKELEEDLSGKQGDMIGFDDV
ncbi:TPA: hypothetical protein NJ263_002864 [Vibrio parahaemolyticus]|nr:hypothetical protein [Vibrio parahaemolyticus]